MHAADVLLQVAMTEKMEKIDEIEQELEPHVTAVIKYV